MEKIFKKQTIDSQVEVEVIETSSNNEDYYGCIREMEKKHFHQVIMVSDMMRVVMKEVLAKKGSIVAIELWNDEPEEKDSFYEPPKIPFVFRLFGKKPNPAEEEAHHKFHHLKSLAHYRDVKRTHKELEELIEVTNEYPFTLDRNIISVLSDYDVQKVTVKLNGDEMILKPNGVFFTESEELRKIVIQAVTAYFS